MSLPREPRFKNHSDWQSADVCKRISGGGGRVCFGGLLPSTRKTIKFQVSLFLAWHVQAVGNSDHRPSFLDGATIWKLWQCFKILHTTKGLPVPDAWVGAGGWLVGLPPLHPQTAQTHISSFCFCQHPPHTPPPPPPPPHGGWVLLDSGGQKPQIKTTHSASFCRSW
jgi:hypothetical protein